MLMAVQNFAREMLKSLHFRGIKLLYVESAIFRLAH